MINLFLDKLWEIQGKYPNINFNINKKYIQFVITAKDSGGATRYSEQKIDISELENRQILDLALSKQVEQFNHELKIA